MVELSQLELSEICNHLGESYPKNIKKVFGGNIHNSWKLEFQQSSIFIKKNIRNKKHLKFEEHCLRDLQKYINQDNLIVPEVIAYKEINNVEILLMEWIEMNKNNQKKLGKGLGEMHLKSHESNQELFGYEIQGFIGTNIQMKGWEKNWADCFINFRIEPQLFNLKINYLNSNLIDLIKTKIKSNLSNHNPNISLVHGDLWSGNIGIGYLNKGVIFDPACWWADSEVEIAMTRLFGGFTDEFYNEYFKVINKKCGAEQRTIIYNFYHILNHANLFGGSYINQVKDYIQLILNM